MKQKRWNVGTLERWNVGTLTKTPQNVETLGSKRRNVEAKRRNVEAKRPKTLERWNVGTLKRWNVDAKRWNVGPKRWNVETSGFRPEIKLPNQTISTFLNKKRIFLNTLFFFATKPETQPTKIKRKSDQTFS